MAFRAALTGRKQPSPTRSAKKSGRPTAGSRAEPAWDSDFGSKTCRSQVLRHQLLERSAKDRFWPERAIRSQRLNTTRNLTLYVRRT